MCYLQISGMSLWNYGPDVMDVLVELVVALVCNATHCSNIVMITIACSY